MDDTRDKRGDLFMQYFCIYFTISEDGGGDQLRIKGHPCFTVLAATINLVCKQILTLNPRLCVRWKALNYC